MKNFNVYLIFRIIYFIHSFMVSVSQAKKKKKT